LSAINPEGTCSVKEFHVYSAKNAVLRPVTVKSLTILVLTLLLFCNERYYIHAQEVRTVRTRPIVSTSFDRAHLQTQIDTIDQPGVASSVKIGYFGGRARNPELPVADGFVLLKAALKKEPVASKRWFWLQNVRGWAAFRCKEISPDEGFAAYTQLFDQADQAKAAKEVLAPQQAVGEWVSSVVRRLRHLKSEDGTSLRDDERMPKLLLKAWTAYVSLLTQTQGRWNGREPDWKGTIEHAGATEEFTVAVEKALNDATVPKTFALLFGAIQVLRYDKPNRALELFAQAKPLLPKDRDGKIDTRVSARFFSDWIEVLQGQKKVAEAQSVARERIALTGAGYGALLKLQLETKDEADIATTLADLSKPDAPEREIVAAAGVLNDRWDKDRQNSTLAKQSETLLTGYLQSARPRSISSELEARYRLGWLLLEQKQTGKAKTALDLSALHLDEKLLNSQSQSFLQSIRAMQARLDTKPGAKP
jgi:hypothetical protein